MTKSFSPKSFAVVMLHLFGAVIVSATSLPSTSALAKSDLSPQEVKVLKSFEKKCANFSPPASQFPDAFLDKSVIASCEIASIFGQDQHSAKLATLQIAQTYGGHATYRSELKSADAILADKYGYPVEEGVMHYQPEIDSNQERAFLDLQHAKLGVPHAIFNLSLSNSVTPASGGNGLSGEDTKVIGQFLGKTLSELIF